MFNNLSEVVISIISGGSLVGAVTSLFLALISDRKAQKIKTTIDGKNLEIIASDKADIQKMLESLKNVSEKKHTVSGSNNKQPNGNFDHFLNYLGIQKKYYDTNLAQTRAVFYIGITLLFIGIVMISAGVIMGLTVQKPDSLALVLTFSSGVLIDFLGTIFVAMHTKTLETAASYQQSISRVSNALLAKSIVDNLEDATMREQALIDIAKGLCKE